MVSDQLYDDVGFRCDAGSKRTHGDRLKTEWGLNARQDHACLIQRIPCLVFERLAFGTANRLVPSTS